MRTAAFVFYLGLGALFTHELDAVTNHEWRVLPLLGALSDAAGSQLFVAAHVPLFAVLVALLASMDQRVRGYAQFGFAVFLVVHGGLHALFTGNPSYEFSSWLSKGLIFGGAACGLLYLVVRGRLARPHPAHIGPSR